MTRLAQLLSLALLCLGVASTACDSSESSGSTTDAADGASDVGRDTSPAPTTCESSTNCFLASNGCCDVCGQPELGDVSGVHFDDADAHRANVCDETNPICPGCPTVTNPWLLAECVQSACVATDLRRDPITACTADEDCKLRLPTCCACGDSADANFPLAIRVDAEAEFRTRVCPLDAGPCPACETEFPQNLRAICSPEGRCAVESSEG